MVTKAPISSKGFDNEQSDTSSGKMIIKTSVSREDGLDNEQNDVNREMDNTSHSINLLDELSLPSQDSLFDSFISTDETNIDKVVSKVSTDPKEENDRSYKVDSVFPKTTLKPEEIILSYDQEADTVNDNKEEKSSSTMDHDCYVNIGNNLFDQSNVKCAIDSSNKKNSDKNNVRMKLRIIRNLCCVVFLIGGTSCYDKVNRSSQQLLQGKKKDMQSNETTFLSCNAVEYYFLRDIHTPPPTIQSDDSNDNEAVWKLGLHGVVISIIYFSFLFRKNKTKTKWKTNDNKHLNLSSPPPNKRTRKVVASLEK